MQYGLDSSRATSTTSVRQLHKAATSLAAHRCSGDLNATSLKGNPTSHCLGFARSARRRSSSAYVKPYEIAKQD